MTRDTPSALVRLTAWLWVTSLLSLLPSLAHAAASPSHHHHANSSSSPPHPPRPHPSTPRLLLWMPVHVSEPTAHVEEAAACLFTRHAPTLVGEPFDVLITVSGTKSDGREAVFASILRNATATMRPPHPTITAEFVHLDNDVYDRDDSKRSRSSYAGPNDAFYAVMLDEEEEEAEGGGGREVQPWGPWHGGGSGAGAAAPTPAPPPPKALSLHRRHAARYAFVQVLETDCCAVRAGWVDTLLAPMLARPHILISGSRVRAGCFSEVRSTCIKRVPSHLRMHINGNAMYRMGPDLQAIVRHARDVVRDKAPFDLALFFVRRDNQTHVHDNPRFSSVGAPVDAGLWTDPGYYGLSNRVTLVHVPRRLRVDGITAAVARADPASPTVAVVVAPTAALDLTVVGAHAPSTTTDTRLIVDVPLLRNLDQALHRVPTVARNLVYVALTRQAYAEAADLAPFRVVLAEAAQKRNTAPAPSLAAAASHARPAYDAQPATPRTLASSALTALAGLVRANLTLFVVGVDAAPVQPDFTGDLQALAAMQQPGSPALWTLQRAGGVAPLAAVPAPDGSAFHLDRLDVGMMVVPPGAGPAAFLERWAGGVMGGGGRGRGVAHPPVDDGTVAGLRATLSADCSPPVNGRVPPTGTTNASIHSPCPWHAANLTLADLPADVFVTGDSYWGPHWTAAARRQAARVVAAGIPAGDVPNTHAGAAVPPSPSPTFRLRQAGLWHQGPAQGCANYSAVARSPLRLGPGIADVTRSLTRYAAFARFVAAHRIECAILPGFWVAATGNAVPYDAVLDKAAYMAAMGGGGGRVLVFPHAGAIDAPPDAFVRFEAEEEEDRAAVPRGLRRSSDRNTVPPSSSACAAANMTGTTCFAPAIAAAIIAAASGLPKAFHCVADAAHSSAELAVLALERRLHEAEDGVWRAVPVDKDKTAITVLLTGGAWRSTAAARAAGDKRGGTLTLADLPGLGDEGAAPKTRGRHAHPPAPMTDPITRLVRVDSPAPGTAAASPWADVIEAGLCQGAAGVHTLRRHAAPPSTTQLLHRLAIHIPPAILEEDLAALKTWLARPARPPSLAARRVRLRWRWRRMGEGGKSPPPPSNPIDLATAITDRQAVTAVTTAMRVVDFAGAQLGFLPGLPWMPWEDAGWRNGTRAFASPPATDFGMRAGRSPRPTNFNCTPASWSATFGVGMLDEAYAGTEGAMLPPSVAVLLQPDAALDVFRDGVTLPLVPGAAYIASAHILAAPRHRRAVAALHRALVRAGQRQWAAAQGLRTAPPTMWVADDTTLPYVPRLRPFIGQGSMAVCDQAFVV